MVCKGKTSGPILATCAASSFSFCEWPWPQLAQPSLPATALEQLLCCEVECTCRQFLQSADSYWHTPGCTCTTAAGCPSSQGEGYVSDYEELRLSRMSGQNVKQTLAFGYLCSWLAGHVHGQPLITRHSSGADQMLMAFVAWILEQQLMADDSRWQ